MTSKTLNKLAHSGDRLTLVSGEKGLVVEKNQSFRAGIRLQEQARKQQQFQSMIKAHPTLHHIIEIPEIVYQEKSTNYFMFGMRYFAGYNIIDVFEKQDIGYTRDIIEDLYSFLDWEFYCSSRRTGWSLPMVEKIDSLCEKINESLVKKSVFDRLKQIVDKNKSLLVNEGICHGDLTCTNIIFSKKLVLIDFLPVYHETPIQDLVKLMQEVRLEWSSLLLDNVRDPVKVKIAYMFMRKSVEKLIDRLCIKYEIDKTLIYIYYLLAILRIVPYTTSRSIQNVLCKEIYDVFDQLNEGK